MEKVYEKGLLHRLSKQGLKVQAQHPLTVCDEDGTLLGNYYADLFVEDCLIVELKTCDALANEHIGQLLGYLRAWQVRDPQVHTFRKRTSRRARVQGRPQVNALMFHLLFLCPLRRFAVDLPLLSLLLLFLRTAGSCNPRTRTAARS
jgi:GxxExxY protein